MLARKLVFLLLILTTRLLAQDAVIDRLMGAELRMAFPSIYFKHNSTDYALMRYNADSCFKYIVHQFHKSINSLVIWRDSAEAEELTARRIKKLNAELGKYIRKGKPRIYSMGNEQKISRRTIAATKDSSKINYLLTLNSVLDVSKTRVPNERAKSLDHIYHPRIWCWNCWKSGFHMDRRSRNLRKTARLSKENQKPAVKEKKKGRRHLVWTDWETGFHWSSPKQG